VPSNSREVFLGQLLNHVTFTDTCWLWTGDTWNGYGKINWLGVTRLVHRVVYIFWNGPICGKHVHHICLVSNCVNPDHLQAVTRSEHLAIHARLSGREPGFCRKGHKMTKANTVKSGACRVCSNADRNFWKNYDRAMAKM